MELIAGDCIPGGTRQNLAHAAGFTDFAGADPVLQHLLADAQTSGGLLLCVAPQHLEETLTVLTELHTLSQSIVGRLTDASCSLIRIES